MKDVKSSFDFKFLNKVMYIGTIIGIFFFLKSLGLMDKVGECLVALVPVFVGLAICWISMPLMNKLRKLGISKGLSAVISLFIIYGAIAGIISLIIPAFASQLTSFIKDLPNLLDTGITKINEFMQNNLGLDKQIDLKSSIANLDIFQNEIGSLLNYSINTVQSIFGVIISIFTTIVVSFFMVKDIDNFKSKLIIFFSRNKRGTNRYKMITEMDETLTSYVKGLFIDSLVVAILTIIVCLVLGIDYAYLFGGLIFILNWIPYIGALLSELIVAIYAFTIGGPVFAIITFVCLLLVQIIDANILQPNIVAKSVDLHPVIVLAGLTVFNLLMGIVGMVVAVPVIAIIKIWLNYKYSSEISELNTNAEIEDIEDNKEKITKKK